MTEANITPFLFEGESLVRVTHVDGQPMFVAADVCRVLGIKNAADAVKGLDADEKGIAIGDTPGGLQEMVAVTESGLYALIFRSRKPAAVRFRKWVTSEVLPSIRSGGSYSIPDTDAPERSETEAGKLRFVVETRMTWGEKAAQQMWLKKGLPTVPAMFEGRQLPLPLDGEG